jgi:hypothetical protein
MTHVIPVISEPTMPDNPADVQVGDTIQTRKPHACGSDQWRIYRVGADIGMLCLGCDRRVMLPYRQFARAMKRYVARSGPPGPGMPTR